MQLVLVSSLQEADQPESCSLYRVPNQRSVVYERRLDLPLSLESYSHHSSVESRLFVVSPIGNFPSPLNIGHPRSLALGTSTQPSVALVSRRPPAAFLAPGSVALHLVRAVIVQCVCALPMPSSPPPTLSLGFVAMTDAMTSSS